VLPESLIAPERRRPDARLHDTSGTKTRRRSMDGAPAGRTTAKNGRELVFATDVDNLPLADSADVLAVITEHGSIAG
jgi:hypothetical protein